MKNYTTTQQLIQNIISITCDKCKITYHTSIHSVEFFDDQEFLQINFIGGYGSIFGDGNLVKCDLCQNCVKELLGEYLTIIEDGKF